MKKWIVQLSGGEPYRRRRSWNKGSKAAVCTAYLRKSEAGQGSQISLEGTGFSSVRLEGFKQRHDVI